MSLAIDRQRARKGPLARNSRAESSRRLARGRLRGGQTLWRKGRSRPLFSMYGQTAGEKRREEEEEIEMSPDIGPGRAASQRIPLVHHDDFIPP